MKGICFKEQLFGLVVSGRKTVTRRMSDRYAIGEILFLKEPYFVNEDGSVDYKSDKKVNHERWRNKLFMPEKYARYFIKIKDKRQERLQDITEEECIKEGIVEVSFSLIDFPDRFLTIKGHIAKLYKNRIDSESYFTAIDAFAALIDKINGNGTWDSNLIITRYEFELLK